MSQLTDHVANALFQAAVEMEDDKGLLGMEDCRPLATVALQAARAQGWRIVRTEIVPEVSWTNPPTETVSITEEWTP